MRIASEKFFVRTFISYLIVIGVVFLLLYIFLQGSIRHFYLNTLRTHLTQIGRTIEPEVQKLIDNNAYAELEALLKKIGGQINIRLTVILPDGKVIADSEKNPAEMGNHGNRPEIQQALKGNAENTSRFSTTMGAPMFYLALPVTGETGETLYVIRISRLLEDVRKLISDLRIRFTAALGVLFLLTLFIAWYFSHGFSRSIKDLVNVNREFAAGNFDAKIHIKKPGELGELARSFNSMVERQRSTFAELNESRAELEAIIASMQEGLLVLTREGKIVHCNHSFEAMSGHENPVDNAYWVVLRIPGFEDLVKKAFASGESINEEMECNRQSYLVGFNLLPEGEKLVVIFRNITDFKNLQQMKRDFVINLTHELKTPLTAIKGFVETLEEEEDIQNTSYIEIIKRHTERMSRIVSDLLILSELEEKKRRDLEFRPIDFASITTSILKIYREKINSEKVSLVVDISPNLPGYQGDQFKIEQMFINLVDNAVKYTDWGTITICIRKATAPGREHGHEHIDIQVKNTGIPIPEESLPRIFERFYVVDKSRSRRLGGTGLGLSIVKHVVLLHNGEISVTSNASEGTVFTITLPLEYNNH